MKRYTKTDNIKSQLVAELRSYLGTDLDGAAKDALEDMNRYAFHFDNPDRLVNEFETASEVCNELATTTGLAPQTSMSMSNRGHVAINLTFVSYNDSISKEGKEGAYLSVIVRYNKFLKDSYKQYITKHGLVSPEIALRVFAKESPSARGLYIEDMDRYLDYGVKQLLPIYKRKGE